MTIAMARSHQGDSGLSSTGLTIALLAGVAKVAVMMVPSALDQDNECGQSASDEGLWTHSDIRLDVKHLWNGKIQWLSTAVGAVPYSAHVPINSRMRVFAVAVGKRHAPVSRVPAKIQVAYGTMQSTRSAI
jgi:hypothetical protein